MTPIKSNRAPLTKRISALAITAAAALSFALFSPNAEAATPAKPTKEFTALQVALQALGETIDSADADQLGQAVANAIANPANAKLKPGNIAGEALKYAAAQDAGGEIGNALRDALATDNNQLIARDAIKRAGSGKGLNVALVPEFTTAFVANDTEAYALAKLVISTKPGAGAVIGGRASQLALEPNAEVTQLALVNGALASKKNGGQALGAAATDIVKYAVMQAVDDSADFTNAVASNPANITLAPKIGTGGVAGDPTNGGDIVDTLLNNASLPKLKTGAASFIKSVGNVADIEEISKIAVAVGNQTSIASATNPKTTAIKFSAANGIVKSLAKAIVAKATTDTSATNPNSGANKEDEIAEVAAYMVAKIINAATVQGIGGGKPQVTIKNAGAKIFAIVMSAVNATKPKKVQTAHPGIYLETAEDVAGSVAETLSSLRVAFTGVILPEFFDTIKAYLVKKAPSIGGKTNTEAVLAAINAAYEAVGPSEVDDAYEDGTIAANVQTSDYPETDFRSN
jgi:hypothetical protein